MPMNEWPAKKRLRIARQFYDMYSSLNARQIYEVLNEEISQPTIRRDMEEAKRRKGAKAPSMRNAVLYAQAMGTSSGINLNKPGSLNKLVDKMLEIRRKHFSQIPTLPYETKAEHALPQGFTRIKRRILEENWTSVIDLIEPILEDPSTHVAYAPIKGYLEFYLALAYQREGDLTRCLELFRTSLETVRFSNTEGELKVDAAMYTALALIDLGQETDNEDELEGLLEITLDNPSRPEIIVNALYIATALDETRFGWWARATLEGMRRISSPFGWEELLVMMMEDKDLQFFHDDDIFRDIIGYIKTRIEKGD